MSVYHQVEKSFQGDNDRLKLVVLFSGEEEEGLVRAAAGCLAILSSERAICHKITTVSISLASGSVQWGGGGGVGAGGRGVSRHTVLGACHLPQDNHG